MLGAPVVPHDEASLMCVAAEQSGLLTRAQCLAAADVLLQSVEGNAA